MKQKELLRKFCHCIKLVTKKVKKESYAIGICVKSVLQTRGKTLKRFSCNKKPMLKTQPINSVRSTKGR